MFLEKVLITKMNETKVIMNKPIFSGLSKLDIIKTVNYYSCYVYIKPKYQEKQILHGYKQFYSKYKN